MRVDLNGAARAAHPTPLDGGLPRWLGLTFALLGLVALGLVSPPAAEGHAIVINEIMYHPPNDQDNLQYVELFNRGSTEVSLAKWAFTKGIKFTFPENARIASNGYLVLCRDPAAFSAHYGKDISPLGPFTGKLSHKKDRLELVDASSVVIDTVQYADADGWPTAPDGYASSLERICPDADGTPPANWNASNLPAAKRASGTPGRQNDSYSTNLPPVVSSVVFSPKVPSPQERVKVTAMVEDSDGVESVTVLYRVVGPNRESEERSLPMKRTAGDEKRGQYEATLDSQSHGQVVRFRVQAIDAASTVRSQPSSNEPRPTYSYFSLKKLEPGRIPVAYLVNVGRPGRGPGHYERTPSRRASPAETTRGRGALLYLPAEGGEPETFDHVKIVGRHGGFKVRFHKDKQLKSMSTINLISEGPMRWILAEPLAYVLYRMAGVPTPLAEHVRVSLDGRSLGFLLLVEQPNTSFLQRNGRDPSGNLYKLLWYGRGVVGQHEKKTNPSTGHTDIIQLIEGLQGHGGADQWAFIQEQFNVEEVASYYAVNMCIQNWDGFFNNYYVYHDLNGSKKWEIYPWDEDKTWGDYDGASSRYNWYSMPLTMGMNGDKSPRDFSFGGGGPFGGVSWWRPPGYLSGPLLANPEFRKVFLARLRQLCETHFSEQSFFPILDTLQQRLEGEVKLRAEAVGESPEHAAREFTGYMESFRGQVQNRRKFILKELSKAQ